MVIQRIVILSLLTTQVLCAPSGCITSCNTYGDHFETQSSGIQSYRDLTQTASQLQGPAYSKPGTWSEHNEYNINNGKVHEERGQFTNGHKTIRYYKKNYSSHDTNYPSNTRLSDIEELNNNYRQGIYVPNSEDVSNSQRTYNQVGNSELVAQQHGYNRIQSQQRTQSAIRRTNTQSENLEDFGEYSGNSQVIQQGTSNINTHATDQPSFTNTQSGNWSKVDSYKTDGGHGRVFEEEGQYMSGPKKVQYYKRNYTSSYGSSNGLPVSGITKIGMDNLHKEIENLHKEMGKAYNHISTTRDVQSSNTMQTNINTNNDLDTDNIYNINNNAYRGRSQYGSNLSALQRNEQHYTDTASEHSSHRNPSQNIYGTSSYNMYERREGHVSNVQPSTQYINPTSGYTNVITTGNSGYNKNTYNEESMLQQTERLGAHQSTLGRNQMAGDNLQQNLYNEHRLSALNTPGRVSQYKEQWSSSHARETSEPHYTSDISQISEQNAQYNSRYRGGNFNYAHQTQLGKLTTGAHDLSHLGSHADCTHGIDQHTHTNSQYHSIYKRNANDENKFDDLTQQTSEKLEFGQQSQQTHQPWRPGSDSQHSEDMTQQTDEFDDLTQQTSGKLEFGQQSQYPFQHWTSGSANQHSEDMTQQTGEFDDLTQQTSGKLEFGQQSQQTHQPWRPGSANQHSEDLTQQTGEFDDLTQQTSGKLEFGQQSQQTHQPWRPGSANQHSEDMTQQTSEFDDLTQQTSGKLEFGQQSQQGHQPWRPGSANQHSEDMTQQTGEFDDLTQQTSGKLEFGQQSQYPFQHWTSGSANQHSEDMTQQTGEFDDLTQQTSGKLEFGEQSQQGHQPWRPGSANQHSQDMTQQTGEFDDLTQQTSGKFEFGQQSQYPFQHWTSGSTNQHSEDLTQQTGEFDDLTQQTSGKLEFGQQSQQTHQPWRPGSGNQHSEDMTQQTGEFDDLTQQTSGKLEFGQQSQQGHQPWRPGSANQHSEDMTQQTGEFDDLTQQTSGKLEFGQQSQDISQHWKSENVNQDSVDLSQQSSVGPIHAQHSYEPQVSGIDKSTPNEHVSRAPLPKPAGKPRPRSRYSRVGSVISLPVENQNAVNEDKSIDKVPELPPKVVTEAAMGATGHQDIRGDQNVGTSMDNDKTLNQQTEGLQWHYTYHPSDRRPFVQQTDEKNKEDLQQQSSNPDVYHTQDNLDQQEAQNKYIFENLYQQSSNAGEEQSKIYQQNDKETDNIQTESKLEYSQPTLNEPEGEQKQVGSSGSQFHLEPRILQAYGGGPYDSFHDNDMYNGVTAKPSATLPPISSADPWDIRDKPKEVAVPNYEATAPPMPVVPLSPDINEPTPPPTFWARIGNKITNTFDKAKEKARNIFG
ncbi:uncharacterized protein LOC116426922 isoform X2 [Nomia melanderi]|uniref:uncharacterized protein LOC116426922 isoform X2 n=1 Tax=Nomia melanderi TaxID=2448451 RepID=UPI003FCE87FE